MGGSQLTENDIHEILQKNRHLYLLQSVLQNIITTLIALANRKLFKEVDILSAQDITPADAVSK